MSGPGCCTKETRKNQATAARVSDAFRWTPRLLPECDEVIVSDTHAKMTAEIARESTIRRWRRGRDLPAPRAVYGAPSGSFHSLSLSGTFGEISNGKPVCMLLVAGDSHALDRLVYDGHNQHHVFPCRLAIPLPHERSSAMARYFLALTLLTSLVSPAWAQTVYSKEDAGARVFRWWMDFAWSAGTWFMGLCPTAEPSGLRVLFGLVAFTIGVLVSIAPVVLPMCLWGLIQARKPVPEPAYDDYDDHRPYFYPDGSLR